MNDLVEQIKENGLEAYLRDSIKSEEGKLVLSKFFEVTCDRLSDEDYEAMINLVCEAVEEEMEDK